MEAGGHWALVVPGHSHRGEPSTRCATLVAHAAALASVRRPDLVVFTGGSRRDGGRTEAEEMLAAWPDGLDVELALEPTARSTIENASRSLPMLLERGVREVTVVCAPLHAYRVRFFFERLFDAAGIRCDVRPAPIRVSPAAVAWELGAVLGMRWQLRSARAQLRAATRR